MVEFKHIVSRPAGLHARPVAQIASIAMSCSSRIAFSCGDRTAEATDLLALMGLSARQGDELGVTVEGVDEEDVARILGDLLSREV